jgi:hypothetical protein
MKKNKLLYIKYKILFVLLFLFVSSLLHFKSYKSDPSSVHAWAQSDHYAIALGFLENNFDFFHPKTFSLNHQFPPNDKLITPQGITAVDFPIIHYVAALGMKLFDTHKPWVFRLVSLLWSFVALYFLFATILKIKDLWTALSIVFFILLIPIYTFYQNSFMPSAAAFNALLIGFAWILRYYYFENKKAFYLGLFFMTLAALMRFTEVIFLIALTGIYFLEFIKRKKITTRLMWSFLGLIIVGAYFYYNKILAQKYGSIFLNKPIIANNISELIGHLVHQAGKYIREFLTLFHLSVLVILYFLYKKQTFKNVFKSPIWLLWIGISFLGVISFNLLMTYHMSGHDYYALDTWIPLLSLVLIYLIFQIDFSIYKPLAPILTFLIISGSLAIGVEKQIFKHKHVRGNSDIIISDFRKSSAFLDKNTTNSQKVLIICDSGWNTPMVGWNKNVYRVAWKFKEQIPQALKEDYDLIITHNASFTNTVLNNMPDFNLYVKKVADNSSVSLWQIK